MISIAKSWTLLTVSSIKRAPSGAPSTTIFPLLPQGIENPLKSPGNVWNQVDSICGDDMVGHIFAYGICKRAILIVALVQKIARYLLLALKKIIGFAQPCR